jgi:hypothetical protein
VSFQIQKHCSFQSVVGQAKRTADVTYSWVKRKAVLLGDSSERIVENIKETLERFPRMLHDANAV